MDRGPEREKVWVVEGERVGLRGTTREAYIDRRVRFFDDPVASALQFASNMPPFPDEMWERLYEEKIVSRAVHFFEVVALETGEVVGEVQLSGLKWPDASCELGLSIFDRSDRGLGYGYEAGALAVAYAFDGLHVHRVWASWLVTNEAIMHLLERFPGKQVGRLRESHFVFGQWQDEVIWDVLRDEWPPHPATRRLRGERAPDAGPAERPGA
jgi:RimJ/RimL family protein N-acetyltransferase